MTTTYDHDRIGTIEYDIEEVEATIEGLSYGIDDAAENDNAELWERLNDEIEEAIEELDRLVAIRDA